MDLDSEFMKVRRRLDALENQTPSSAPPGDTAPLTDGVSLDGLRAALDALKAEIEPLLPTLKALHEGKPTRPAEQR